MGQSRRVPTPVKRRAFSLLELLIAIGILGVGLVMVATIFPVALTQHRISLEKGRAGDLVGKAESIMHSRYDSLQFWVHPAYAAAGVDSPWYMLPMANLEFAGGGRSAGWDSMPIATPYLGGATPPAQSANPRYLTYANAFNDAFDGSAGNPFDRFGLVGLDPLSDRVPNLQNPALSPFTSEEFGNEPMRFAWCGFYRRLANGLTNYSVAVCRVRQNERYVQQDVAGRNTIDLAIPAQASPLHVRRLPVPWRVQVAFDPTTRRIGIVSAGREGLGELAPPGSKMIIHGRTYSTMGPLPEIDTGRVLTVANVIDTTLDGVDNFDAVEILEDPTGLPWGTLGYAFDVIVFPPPVTGGDASDATFGRESPLMEWKAFL